MCISDRFYGEDEDRPDPRAFNNQAVWKLSLIHIYSIVSNDIFGATP